MRAMNLSNALVAAGHQVVLWSSAFSHQKKFQRENVGARQRLSDTLEIRLIASPGYKRNVGLGRLWDHAVLARNLKRALRDESDLPDVAFVGYPPIETAAVLVRWLRGRRIPSILDVKDQWPTLFLDPLPNALQPFGRAALAPYSYLAKRAMREATGLTAMAESFLAWSLAYTGRERRDTDAVFPLTSAPWKGSSEQLEVARRAWDARGVHKDPSMVRLSFVGSHMVSAFDFRPIREAAAALAGEGARVQFVICGDGPATPDIKALLAGLPNVVFTGWIDATQIEVLAERTQATLIPYRNIENYTTNLPNKVIDSLRLGLPLLSPLEGEVERLIDGQGVGMRYGSGPMRSLADCIRSLILEPGRGLAMRQNAQALYESKFSYQVVYGAFVKHLERLAAGRP